MRKIVFDIETKNIFADVGKRDPSLLDISLVGIYDSETDSYDSFLEEDLPRLWNILESADVLIGYNSDHFDMPLLNKYYPGDLTRIKSVDLMKEISNSCGRRLALDAVAEATIGAKKSGHGLQAVQWWKEGKIEEIRKYCLQDVKVTKEVYDFAIQNKKVMYKDTLSKQIIEVPLDTSLWDEKEDSGMTMSLGF